MPFAANLEGQLIYCNHSSMNSSFTITLKRYSKMRARRCTAISYPPQFSFYKTIFSYSHESWARALLCSWVQCYFKFVGTPTTSSSLALAQEQAQSRQMLERSELMVHERPTGPQLPLKNIRFYSYNHPQTIIPFSLDPEFGISAVFCFALLTLQASLCLLMNFASSLGEMQIIS